MTPSPATPADLAALLEPFVGTFRQIHRGDGSRVDLHHQSDSIDADIRAVTAEGVERFFYDRCEFIPWDKLRGVTIAKGGAERVYLTDAELVRLSAAHRRFVRAA